MKSKKIIYLSVEDLRELGLLPKKYSRKSKGRKKKEKVVFVDSNGKVIKAQDGFGGQKTDSAHMVGGGQTISQITQPTQFTNSANMNTAIQSMQLQALEDARKTKADETNQLVPTSRFQNNTDMLNQIDQKLLNYVNPLIQRISDSETANNSKFANINDNMNKGYAMLTDVMKPKPTVRFDSTDNAGNFAGTFGSDDFIPQGEPINDIVDRFEQDKEAPNGLSHINETPIKTIPEEETNYFTPFETSEASSIFDTTPIVHKIINPTTVEERRAETLAKLEHTPFRPKQTPRDDTQWEDIPEDKSKQPELTPETAKINKQLETKGRGAKGNLKDSLKVYVALGGTDADILMSKSVMKVQAGIKKLKKSKGLNF